MTLDDHGWTQFLAAVRREIPSPPPNRRRRSDPMEPASIKVNVPSPQVQVHRGEYLTVWLGEFDDPAGRTQVELCVLHDGRRRICLPTGSPVEVTTFESAYSRPVSDGKGDDRG